MKLDEFINKYINTKIDFDGVFGAQCVDLFRQYCKDVLNIPHTGSCSTSGGAIDLFLDYEKMPLEKKYFKKLSANKAYNDIIFKYGDVAIWNKTSNNKYGHVAIVIGKTDGKNILVFEQNGITQNGAKLSVRNISNMLGVLRFNGGSK